MNNRTIKAERCPNCESPLAGENFCPECGQKNDTRRFTFWHFISESVSHFLAFDGRFFTTFKKIISRPGLVPKEFIKGKRMKYMNPLRLYFISSIILLFVAQLGNERTAAKIDETEANEELTTGQKDSIITKELDALPGVPLNLTLDTASQNHLVDLIEQLMDYSKAHPSEPAATALENNNLENTFWHRFLYHQAAKISNFEIGEFNKYLRSKMFWVLFFFLPVLALLLKLLYIRRDFYYTEHLFFTFYSQAVYFMILTVALLFNPPAIPITIGSLLFVVYLYLSMKRFYDQSSTKTFFKLALLNILVLPAFGVFFLLATLVVFILF